MLKEIDAAQHSIDEVQKRLDGFAQEQWKFFVKSDDQVHRIGEGFPSMRDLLSSLIAE